MEVTHHTLSNGIRLVHMRAGSHVGHCGLLINTGSRDEKKGQEGIAHFIEHLLFKGTQRRKAFHIVSRIDEIGGELNAYTSKENTFVYANFPGNYLDRSLDIISDIAFHSTFPEREMEKERLVVLDEILSYRDDPSEEISDEFDTVIFSHHTLGANILGTRKTVESFRQRDIHTFIKENYHTDQMVLGYVGPEPAQKFFEKAEKYFGHIHKTKRPWKRSKPGKYKATRKSVEKDAYSCHAIIGNRAYDAKSKLRLPFFLLNNILGGPGLNSRLNLNIRERYGYTYYLDSSYVPYEDSGLWYIYLATDKKNLRKTLALVYKELEKLCRQPLGKMQFEKAQLQLKGQVAIANENNSAMLGMITRSTLVFNEVDSLEETYRQIDAVTPEQLMEMANTVFNPDELSELVYLSKK